MSESTSDSVPTLDDLPPPPDGKTGWPWTEQSDPLPEAQPDGSLWPKISIVTPSYNQGQFLEETIRSVLLQGYPNLEYVVMDGGSTDQSVDIIRKYDAWIDHWASESDRSQSHAINKGFRRCTGDFGNWQNSDDLFHKNAFRNVVTTVGSLRDDTFYVGNNIVIDKQGTRKHRWRGEVNSLRDLVNLSGVWQNGGAIPQAAVLFPLDAYHAVGGLDEDNKYTMDYDLWGRFFLHGLEVEYLDIDVGMFRQHMNQKTARGWEFQPSIVQTAHQLVDRCEEWSEKKKRRLHVKLQNRLDHLWKETGPLARAGLPEGLVLVIRRGHERWKRLRIYLGSLKNSLKESLSGS
jgi:glycosyltransferase involved in cell wall biosynthesis